MILRYVQYTSAGYKVFRGITKATMGVQSNTLELQWFTKNDRGGSPPDWIENYKTSTCCRNIQRKRIGLAQNVKAPILTRTHHISKVVHRILLRVLWMIKRIVTFDLLRRQLRERVEVKQLRQVAL